jgi:hypothetical protein
MRRVSLVIVAALLVGTAARAALVAIAPRYGFLGDHVDYVCWGRQAVADGVLTLYERQPTPCRAMVYFADRPAQLLVTGSDQRLNYPALAAYVFAITGHMLAAFDPSETANTVTSRAVYAVPTLGAELATAAGAGALVATFASPTAAAWAAALTWLAPPLLLDGAFWGQTEAWVLAPALWMVWAMVRGRWLAAGLLFGIALALKPSALLFGPLWAYAFFFRRPRVRVLLGGAIAVATVAAVALPFWLSSGTAWLTATYLSNYVYDLHWTTMLTFNVWYVDLLLTERLDSRALLLGVPRDTWGTIFLVAGLAIAFALARRFERRAPTRAPLVFLPLAALVSIAAVSLPTRVHGTYTAFTIPFALCCAFLIPRAALGAAALVVASSLQILSWQWGNLLAVHVLPDESVFPPARYAERRALRQRDRPREWALTALSLGAAVAMFGAVAWPDRRRDDDAPTDARVPTAPSCR